MKKVFILFAISFVCISISTKAQNVVKNNYGDKTSPKLSLSSSLESSTKMVSETNDDTPIMSAVFANYTGYDKAAWGAEAIMLVDKGFGFNTGLKYMYIASNTNVFWWHLGLNYSFNLIDQDETRVFIAASFEPALASYSWDDGSSTGDSKINIDAMITPRLVAKFGHLSAHIGYQWTANKFKFKKKSVIDGFTVGLGYAF